MVLVAIMVAVIAGPNALFEGPFRSGYQSYSNYAVGGTGGGCALLGAVGVARGFVGGLVVVAIGAAILGAAVAYRRRVGLWVFAERKAVRVKTLTSDVTVGLEELQYVFVPGKPTMLFPPVVVLKLRTGEELKCPLVSEGGFFRSQRLTHFRAFLARNRIEVRRDR